MPSPLDSLNDRQRGTLALVVGTVLLLSPLYATAFHIDGQAYTYRTAPVYAEDGAIVVEGVDTERVNDGYIAGVACTELRRTRGCGLDRHIAAHGPLTASADYDGGPEFTRVDGTYYRRVATDVDEGVRLRLERVTAQAVINEVDVSESSLTWPGRVAILLGGVTTTYPLAHGGHVVDTGDGHHLVYLTRYERAGGAGDDLLILVGLVAGTWLVVRGYVRLSRG